MVIALFVTVLLAGAVVPASRPARIVDGYVVVPLDPFVRRVAQVIRIDRDAGKVVVERDARSFVLRFGPEAVATADGTVYVRLAPVVRGLGGTVTFDAVRKVAAIEMPEARPLVTPTPFDPTDPSVAPRRIFTPEPTVTPRPTLSGIPQPRRTPIPVSP